MAPVIDISIDDFERASKILTLTEVDYTIPQSDEDFIYVPSIELDVAKEKKFYGSNWIDSHQKLQSGGEKMLTIPEFIEFLRYSRIHFPEIYEGIAQVKNSWRGELLDAKFEKRNEKLYMASNHALVAGNFLPKISGFIDEDTLMENRLSRTSLENWLENPTKQGLLSKHMDSPNLFYWPPKGDDLSVARFFANSNWVGIDCNWPISESDALLGVRAARKRE